MTNDEAIDLLNILGQYGLDMSIKFHQAAKMGVEALRNQAYLREQYNILQNRLIEALEKNSKYYWHNLRKNPEDLPDHDAFYFVAVDCFGCVGYTFEEYSSKERKFKQDVLAWRLMEEFEEVE